MSDNTDFVAEARTKCAMSIRNTAVGDWLGDALRRLEEADAENAQLREAIANEKQHVQGRDYHIQKRDREIADLRADNARLRETLEDAGAAAVRIRECDMKRIADLQAENERLRKALESVVKSYDWDRPMKAHQTMQKIARKALEGGQ